MFQQPQSAGSDIYSRFIGKLNYIGHQLLTIGRKSERNIGLTLTRGDTFQLCQVLGVTEEQLMRRYKGQTVIYYDTEGKPHAWINFVLYERGGPDD